MTWQHNGVEVDTTDWPLVQVFIPVHATVQDLARLLEYYDELCRGVHKEIVWLIDFRELDPVFGGLTARRAAADRVERHQEALAVATKAEVRVVEGSVSRGILVAFDWLARNPWPVANVGSMAEAHAWIARNTDVALPESVPDDAEQTEAGRPAKTARMRLKQLEWAVARAQLAGDDVRLDALMREREELLAQDDLGRTG